MVDERGYVTKAGQSSVCLTSAAFRNFAGPLGLTDLLSARGITCQSVEPFGSDWSRVTAILTCGSADPDHEGLLAAAASEGMPVIAVEKAAAPSRWRLAEFDSRGSSKDDLRLERLVTKFRKMLDGDAVSAFVGSLSRLSGRVDEGDLRKVSALLPTVSRPERFGVKPSLEMNRDRIRLALAVDTLFNDLPNDPEELAAALDEAISAVGKPLRQSVSIVITNYNYRRFVGAAVESAFNQTVSPLEVVVVDDGSLDGSAELIAAMPGIVPVLKANGGQASAFNEGFRYASGDIVVFLDADDRLLPDAVDRIGLAMIRGVSRLQYGLETIDSEGNPIGLYLDGAPAARGDLLGRLWACGGFSFMPTSGNAFPRGVLDAVLPMPEENWALCADLYLALACALLGETKDLDLPLGQYRIHGQNGHYRVLGSEPYLQPERAARQQLALDDLLSDHSHWLPRALAEQLALANDSRLLFSNQGKRRSRRSLAGIAWAALLRSLGSASVPYRTRLGHALLPLRSIFGLGPPPINLVGSEDGLPFEHLKRMAGPSTWPRLTARKYENFVGDPDGSGIVGHGWTESTLRRPAHGC